VDRKAKQGDQVTLDFHGTDGEGKEVAGTRTKGYDVVIGSKTLLPGFEDALVSLGKGEQKSFTLTFPDNYHAEHLRKKPVTFHVTVTKIEEVDLPAFDDAFAKEHGLGATAEEAKKRIGDSMRQEEEMVEQQRRERLLFDAIRKATKVELAPELLDQTQQNLLQELQQQLQRQGITIEEWMKKREKKPEEILKEMHEQAEGRLMLRFGVEKLLEELKIEVTDDEVRKIVAEIRSQEKPEDALKDAGRYAPGSEDFEQLRWQKKVEKLVTELLNK
jgi:trigger factor